MLNEKKECDICKLTTTNFKNVLIKYNITDIQKLIDKINNNDNDLGIICIELYIINNINCIDSVNINFFSHIKHIKDANNHNIDEYSNKTINQYVLKKIIGRGGNSVVYLALNINNNKNYAIKVIPFKKSEEKDRNTALEISIMKKINHTNIIKLYEVIEDVNEYRIYLIMQYMENGPIVKLDDTCTCKPIEIEKALDYLSQIVQGLKYLHKHNIIHKDIKPANILIDGNDNVYLSDFGISEIMYKNNIIKDKRGTLLFSAPELFLTYNSVNGYALDMWGLGVTFFTMIYGYLPFYGLDKNNICKRVIYDNPSYPDDISEEYLNFFNNILHKDPKNRMTLDQLEKSHILQSRAKRNNVNANVNNVYEYPTEDDINNAINYNCITTSNNK